MEEECDDVVRLVRGDRTITVDVFDMDVSFTILNN